MFMYFLHSSLAENHEQVIGVVRYRNTLYIYIYMYIYIYFFFPLFPISLFQITRRFKIR